MFFFFETFESTYGVLQNLCEAKKNVKSSENVEEFSTEAIVPNIILYNKTNNQPYSNHAKIIPNNIQSKITDAPKNRSLTPVERITTTIVERRSFF